jgi:hypothetical protein
MRAPKNVFATIIVVSHLLNISRERTQTLEPKKMSHTTSAGDPKQLNIPGIRGVLQKYQDSTNLALFLLVVAWVPFAIIANQAIQEVAPAGLASQFRFQSSVIAIGMCLLIPTLITMANWFALRKVAQAIDEAKKPTPSIVLPPPKPNKEKKNQ